MKLNNLQPDLPTHIWSPVECNFNYQLGKVYYKTLNAILDLKLDNKEISLREWYEERKKNYNVLTNILKNCKIGV